jgi:hypothetical protein
MRRIGTSKNLPDASARQVGAQNAGGVSKQSQEFRQLRKKVAKPDNRS